ncbi:hypothetical protein KA005_20300 [bacterium]|nr:hypothetical protein [bacterium]
MKNKKMSKLNTSGACGVSLNTKGRKWIAQIGSNGKRVHIGRYETKEDAIVARKNAEKELWFHKNHGLTEVKK